MRKLLIILFLINSIYNYAQESSSIGFTIGTAFPQGEFFKESSNLYGVARMGTSFEAFYKLEVSKLFTLVASSRFTKNNIDNKVFARNLELNQLNRNITSVFSDPWRTYSLLVGPQLNHLWKESRVLLSLRGMFGYTYAESPEMIIAYSRNSSNLRSERKTEGSHSMGYLIGLGTNYLLNQRASIAFAVNYFTTKAKFDEIKFIDSPQLGSTVMNTESLEQTISILATEIGLAYKF